MKKSTAHIVWCGFDLLSFGVSYYLFRVWVTTVEAIASSYDVLNLQGGFGIFLLAIIVPLVHLASIFEANENVKAWMNRGLVGCFVALVGGAVYLSTSLENRIVESGYIYCESQSESMTFSEFKTFVLNVAQCPDG